ncbi:type I restriction endonuclease subunit R [Clostridium botulinum]|uniref:Type I restriction enzyme endonuclease subunit n=1 Tax=Clostridium botulinum TaxID=1491 RepID=A0A0L9YD05_CLOBO|nr:type I restriction endonuclease subunit R [Clostridium botulinum]KOM89585.1 restriction endonuclease subunit R [Clostridium botulinum]KOR60824.1 restriction endonuclease subunit R [Clostridium botulinum]MBN1075024.1 type I restriction endonuclease subunit R [Clostridium botulinum]MCS6110253.1 type I restriction endonuclease subunit R [Clostridium botulinum]NFE58596.1 type I restriction endonuclease subunit R [Clostridium botulinum]
MSYQSEAELERLLVEQLVSQGYEKVKIEDEASLIENFREQLYLHNESKLDKVRFTDKEFERILRHVEGKSVFQSAKILRDKFILDREDDSKVYLEFFDSKQWCKNRFQVTTQTTVVGKYTNRYDVTLLINGLPLIQIELKRRGLDLKEAFNQIERYRKHSYQGLYRYIQVFVVSNGVDTKYFANTDKELLFSQTFFWTDVKNERISNLNEFTQNFLEKCHIAKVIARYMVINESDKALMIMRPYQIFAVEALINRALETNNNGYIWHTTGSGKTLTSFKVSQILSNEPSIKKVFFLVDRKDLDSQTLSEFNKFEPDSVDTTDKTFTLVNQIKDINKPLIVTTIQKMANAINTPKYANIMDKYKDEKVVFIIDECHRSQFGDMHKAINKHFSNAQYFGFTGTPRFEENKSQDGRVTADLFEKCLHTYLIKDAINDGNVLGFSVEYIKTFSGDYDENDDTKVSAIDTDEVIMSNERISLVADHIIKNHPGKTRNMEYTAIFTVQSIPMLVKYYDKFKELNHNLKIAGIFTYGANEESEGKDEHSRDSLERMISDYNSIFDTNYSTDTFSNYFADVSKRVKKAQIDILLVVNMFLTGFDSKTLNTLYVDKNLKYHDLIQAFSRTNRVQKATKPYGNIVCYRNLKKRTDDAIRLFSQTHNTDTVLMESYENYLDKFKAELARLLKLTQTPSDVDSLEAEEDKKKFIISFRELSKALVKLQTFTDFEFKEDNLGISEQTYQDFKSKYFLIYDSVKKSEGDKVSILADIDFGIELMHTDKINVSYIMNLIRDIDLSDAKKRDKDVKNILKELDRADNEELRLKVELLKTFLNKVVPTLSPEDSIEEAYNDYHEEKREEEVEEFASEVGLEKENIKSYLSEYEYSGLVNQKEISDDIVAPFLKKKKIVKVIKDFIFNHVEKFSL